jgi:hypothetical protein
MKKKVLYLLGVSILAAASVIWISCGGGGGGSGSSSGGSSTGSVALYATDDMSEDYKQVTVTVNKVSLEQTGTGDTCDLLTTPVTLDITDLSSMIQLLDVATCPTVNYNRVHIEFSEQVVVTDTSDITTTCNFTSYKDKGNNPNVLICDAGSCSIDMNGAVNVFADQNNELALDFDLKKFEVEDFNSPDCSVTMKVSPINSDDMDGKHDDGYEEGISGNVSNVDTGVKSFTLSTESGDFTVSYVNVITDGINNILTLAETEGLEVKVRTSGIDLDTGIIEASAIEIEVEGTVSALDTLLHTFTLTYNTDKTLTVNYSSAEEVEGVLINGASAEVKLNAWDGVNYLAREVEVEEDDD